MATTLDIKTLFEELEPKQLAVIANKSVEEIQALIDNVERAEEEYFAAKGRVEDVLCQLDRAHRRRQYTGDLEDEHGRREMEASKAFRRAEEAKKEYSRVTGRYYPVRVQIFAKKR